MTEVVLKTSNFSAHRTPNTEGRVGFAGRCKVPFNMDSNLLHLVCNNRCATPELIRCVHQIRPGFSDGNIFTNNAPPPCPSSHPDPRPNNPHLVDASLHSELNPGPHHHAPGRNTLGMNVLHQVAQCFKTLTRRLQRASTASALYFRVHIVRAPACVREASAGCPAGPPTTKLGPNPAEFVFIFPQKPG